MLASWFTATQEAEITGSVTRYDAGLMEQVAVNRGIITDTQLFDDWLALHNYDGMVALQRKADLFRTVYIDGERFFVVDCRQLAHYPGPHVVEVGYPTARRWLDRGPWPAAVTVSFTPPPSRRRAGLPQ